jgi:AraC-like DNA-binding protein
MEVMPSATARSFTDAEPYAAFVPSTKVQLTIVERGEFKAEATLVSLRDLWMQRFSDNLARVAHAAAKPGRAVISFRTTAGPRLTWGGIEMTPATILRHDAAFDSFQRSSGPAAWGSVSFPVAAMANTGSVMAGQELAPPRTALSVAPSSTAMLQLQRIHALIGWMTVTSPEILSHPEAVRSIEQALLDAVASCLNAPESHGTNVARDRHLVLMRRFHALLEANPEDPIYLPELSSALGVSARTLRACCQEHLGMGPKRYLMLRRMYFVRRALMEGTRDTTTVTDSAMRYGFWELGRFAATYKSVFCESPSATLQRH